MMQYYQKNGVPSDVKNSAVNRNVAHVTIN